MTQFDSVPPPSLQTQPQSNFVCQTPFNHTSVSHLLSSWRQEVWQWEIWERNSKSNTTSSSRQEKEIKKVEIEIKLELEKVRWIASLYISLEPLITTIADNCLCWDSLKIIQQHLHCISPVVLQHKPAYVCVSFSLANLGWTSSSDIL